MKNKTETLVRMRDLSVFSEDIRNELLDKLREIMSTGDVIQGKYVRRIEGQIKDITSINHAISCASASSGLYLALKALNLAPNDEVITTPLTWLVTASAIIQAGAKPVFVDVDDNFNLDPVEVEKAITINTKAILVVHYYGRLAQIESLVQLARERGLILIEDSAQAFGVIKDGRMAGTYGDIGVYSFSPMKVVGGMGDAGMIVTKHELIAERIKVLRHCGTIDKEYCVSPELKHIMDELHAAFLTVIVGNYSEIIKQRREKAMYYKSVLPKQLVCPDLGGESEHSAYDFVIRYHERDRFHEFLNMNGIESRIRHPILVSDQSVHANSFKHELPRASRLVREALCLPIHNNITHREIEVVGNVAKLYFKSKSELS